MDFSLKDLGLAFRKAKVDLYYSSNASFFAIAEYEKELTKRLDDLFGKLNSNNDDWIKNKEFLGEWTVAPKVIRIKKDTISDGLVFSSPEEKWKYYIKSAKPNAEFRLMAQCSLDFHVLSTLWMLKVGHKYDNQLSDCAYGNRLRRRIDGSINEFSCGSFKPYQKPFREWRDGGIKAMRSALAAKKK